MAARNVVVVDLGAESGRVVLGRFDGARVALQEVHRFPTPPRPQDDHLRWDQSRLWSEITAGLAAAGVAAGTVDAVGVDAWGVDCGLLGRDGELLGDPVSYRDPRTKGLLEEAIGRVGRERLYLATDIQLIGMWLLQESRRQWAREGREHSYEELVRLAASRDTPIHSSSLILPQAPQAEADLRLMLRRASAGPDLKGARSCS